MTYRVNGSLPQAMQRRTTTVIFIFLVFALILGAWGGPKVYLWLFSVKENNGTPTDQASDCSEDSISNNEKDVVADALTRFICVSLAEDEGANKICLPVNDYLLLSALIEASVRDTQQNIISLLGMEDANEIRSISNYLHNKVLESGRKSVPATSVWLNNTYSLQQENIVRLIDNPLFDVYEGMMGKNLYNHAMQTWVRQTTNRGIDELSYDSGVRNNCIWGLLSTIYIEMAWTRFSRLESQNKLFFTKTGSKSTAFMTTQFPSHWYYQGQHFNAVRVLIEDSTYMWFILPEEGFVPEEIVLRDEFSEFLHKQFFKTNSTEKAVAVSLSFPRFSFAVDNDLQRFFLEFGFEKCFYAEVRGLSAIKDEKGYPGFIRQYASISVNEEGINRISFPHLQTPHRDPLFGENIIFLLNRPFIFLLVEENNIPILAAVVNNP